MNRKPVLGVLVAATTIVVAGCGASAPGPASAPGASSSSSASTQRNDADIAFVQGMIPHHMQAVAMSQLVTGRASSPQVIDLAKQIEQAQGPEITQMQGFLQGWNVPATPTMGNMGGMSGMGGMGGTGGMQGMSGMMSDQQMQQLGSATAAAFDKMFLQMMIEHHTGAIQMAQTELRDGQNAEVKALAQKIIDGQQAEITTMNQLLTTV